MLSTNIDFMWLAEGRTIDHSTICGFRTKFRRELKQLFKQVFKIAMRAGLAKLETVALDATRVKANSSRHEKATAATITERMARLDQMIERMLVEAEQADAAEPGLYALPPIPYAGHSHVHCEHITPSNAKWHNYKRAQDLTTGQAADGECSPLHGAFPCSKS